MALKGTFTVNDADFSPLMIFGVGTFMAYSGNRIYRNRAACASIQNSGPIPEGRYHIVDRPTGGVKGVLRNIIRDSYSWTTPTPVIKAEWFALYSDDHSINDYTWINGVERGNFRLHPPGPYGISLGCITLEHRSDFITIRQSLLAAQQIRLTNGLMSYGIIEVIANGKAICPDGD